MKIKSLFFLLTYMLLLTSCTDIVPVWSSTQKLADMTLYYSKPVEFTDITITVGEEKKPKDFYLELDITYYTPIGRTDLPLNIVFENVKNTEKFPYEFDKIIVPLKVEDKWQGKQEDYETDFTLTYIAIPSVKIPPGTYRMKVYANDAKSEKIYGVVKIGARLYENEGGKAKPNA